MADDLSTIPDVYSDLFNIMENPLGVMMVLLKSQPPQKNTSSQPPSQAVAVLRFSPENWKVILMTGRKQLKNREAAIGVPIKIPADLLASLSLTEADW